MLREDLNRILRVPPCSFVSNLIEIWLIIVLTNQTYTLYTLYIIITRWRGKDVNGVQWAELVRETKLLGMKWGPPGFFLSIRERIWYVEGRLDPVTPSRERTATTTRVATPNWTDWEMFRSMVNSIASFSWENDKVFCVGVLSLLIISKCIEKSLISSGSDQDKFIVFLNFYPSINLWYFP